MNISMINAIVSMLNLLPADEGMIVLQEREQDDGQEKIRVWAIEFPGQTIHLSFVFDDTIEREMAFAQLMANGANLLRYFASISGELEVKHEDLLGAFRIVFNQLMDKVDQLQTDYADNQEEPKEEEPPTVGEKGD